MDGEKNASVAEPPAAGLSGRPRRVVVKLSGEALGGAGLGIEPDRLRSAATELAQAAAAGAQVGLVIGGGNLFRGASRAAGISRVTGDHIGMLATIMNALAFRDALQSQGTPAEVLSSHAIASVVEGYSARRAGELLDDGVIVLFAGGTGNPLFTTDTAACLRGIEVGADWVVKATKVDGVYSADPLTDESAVRFDELTYMDVIEKRLGVMDHAAMTLCQDHDLPVVVCDVGRPGALTKAVGGAKVGTRICADTARSD